MLLFERAYGRATEWRDILAAWAYRTSTRSAKRVGASNVDESEADLASYPTGEEYAAHLLLT